jgi:hypothetical protein
LESAEECVTTHLPKRAVPKMDDAQASALPSPYSMPPSRQQLGQGVDV